MNMQQQQRSDDSMPIPRRPISFLSLLSPTRFNSPSLPRSSITPSPQSAFNFKQFASAALGGSSGFPPPHRLHPRDSRFHGVPVTENYMANMKRTFEQIFTLDDVERGKGKRSRQDDKEKKPLLEDESRSSSATNSSVRSWDRVEVQSDNVPTFKDPSSFRRRWNLRVPRGTPLKPGEFQFTVLSYNILAQGLLVDNPYLYKGVNPLYLDWNYRKANLLQEIVSLNADIVCLQEVEGEHFHSFFQPMLANHGYAAIFKQRTGKKNDGCAIFFKADSFQLVTSKCVSYYRQHIPLLDRDNVGIVALLKTARGPKQHLCVATTHLLFNPKRGDIKLAQLGMLLAEIDQLSHYKTRRSGDCIQCPVILCGDMNSLPRSPLSRLIHEGSLDFKDIPSGEISGQKEGRKGGVRFLQRPPIPAALRITRDCQYLSVLEDRRDKLKQQKSPKKKENERKEDRNFRETSQDDDDTPWEEVQDRRREAACTVRHPFSFSSVYSLEEDGKEVTSNHSRTNCMVDYIFYTKSDARLDTRGSEGRTKMEGKLDLIASLQLFTDEEATTMGGLPNKIWSSDHFALMGSFILR